MTTPSTTGLPPQSPNRWSLIERIAAAYFVLLGLIVIVFFEELIGEFGSGLWREAKDWVAQNQFRAFEVASVLVVLLAIFMVAASLRVVHHFGRRREQRRAQLVDPKDLLNLESDLRASRFQLVTTIAQIGGGTALLVGIYFTYQNLVATREGQVTDRFIRAVDQLGAKDKDGNPAPEIRLGGVYGLRRVAQDSREDYQPIRKILNDYVRINAPWPPTNSAKAASPTPATGPTPAVAPTPAAIPTLRADIQAALDFLGQPITKYEKLSVSAPVNLLGVDLRGASLHRLHLGEAWLDGAHLEDAIFEDAHLEEAWLRGAHLEDAIFEDAHLEGAWLDIAYLEGAYLNRAHLKGADLQNADLQNAHLDGADLDGALLEDADLDGADLSGALNLTPEQIFYTYRNAATKLPPHLEPYRPASWK